MSGIDYYRILGVPPSATRRAIREAYLGLVRRLHPDRVGPEGTAYFQQVTEAYENLSDPAKRRAFDRDRASASGHPRRKSQDVGTRHAAEPLVTEPMSHSSVVDFEVVLTPLEALRGATLPLVLPVIERCRWCGGRSRDYLPCTSCGGDSFITAEQVVQIRIPSHVQHGSLIEVPLGRGPGRSWHLRLHISISSVAELW